MIPSSYTFIFFFFNDTATTEIYTLSLHDALPICATSSCAHREPSLLQAGAQTHTGPVQKHPAVGRRDRKLLTNLVRPDPDRKSTRLNSSHSQISYAVFCLKKKKNKYTCILLSVT